MSLLSQYLRISHCRDILVSYIKCIKTEKNIFYKYEIPLYGDTPRGNPIINIIDNKMTITFVKQDQ